MAVKIGIIKKLFNYKKMRGDFLYPNIETKFPVSDVDLENLGGVLSGEDLAGFVRKEKALAETDATWKMAREHFNNDDGTPWEMSPGELAIFKLVLYRQHPRAQIVASTQWGKTLTVSRAILMRLCTFPGEWMLVVPDTKRGQIMINYMIKDTANNDLFTARLAGKKIKDTNLLMRLLEEKSKVKLTYLASLSYEPPKYGSVQIITAEARRKNNAITSIMGFGGRNVIADESALVDDDVDSGIFRMLAGKGEDTFLVNIGNPFFRNHFLETWKDKRYKKIFVDYQIGLAEGRYIPEFIEEAKRKPNFDVLFECKFPSATSADNEGWSSILTDEEIKLAMQGGGSHFGEERIGVDPADEGDNYSVIVKRSQGLAEVTFRDNTIDAFQFAGPVVLAIDASNSKKGYIDKVGTATYGKVSEVNRVTYGGKLVVTGINAGEACNDRQFFNKKAEMYWRVRQWVKSGGRLNNDQNWLELAKVKYKTNEKGQIVIMGKEEMRKRNIKSPDVAEALAQTFYDPPTAVAISEEEKFFMKKMRENAKKKAQGYNLKMVNR